MGTGPKVDVTSGFRRGQAMRKLVEDNAEGWTDDTLVRVDVFQEDAPDVELLLKMGTDNLERSSWNETGVIRWAGAARTKGASIKEIARICARSEKQVDRYIAI